MPVMQPPDAVVQVCPRFDLQTPLPSQVPGQLSVSSWLLTATHEPPGPEQVWQLPVQSLALQQLLLSMQVVPHGLKPVAHPWYLQLFDEVSHWPIIPF